MNPRYRHGMNWIRQEKRLALYMRDGFACLYCGTGIEVEGTILTLDHVDHHGTNHETNLVTACFDCNRGKSCWSLNRWLKRVGGEKARARIERAWRKPISEFLDEAKKVIRERTGRPF